MGAGKTTVGEALAKRLQYNVIDMDEWIERKTRTDIKQIFENKGESYFRTLETEALQEITGDHLIITTGGGVVMKKYNREYMRNNGTVIYLKCELDEIFSRLEGDKSRPNFQGDKEEITKLYRLREPLYEEAAITINTTGKSVQEIVNELRTKLKL